MESRSQLFRVLIASSAIVISAFACISYMAHAVAYSDVFGVVDPSAEALAASENRRALIALTVSVLLQFVAVVSAAPLFASQTIQSLFAPAEESRSRVVLAFRYLAVLVSVATLNVTLAAIILQFLR